MPKKYLSEEEKYKAKVKKSFNFSPDVDTEKVIDSMWQREDKKRLDQQEKAIEKYMIKKGRKPNPTPEPNVSNQVAPGYWRDKRTRASDKKPVKIFDEKEKKIGWI